MAIDRAPRTNRLAPLAPAGLAALVAGSLLTFSALAFNTAFDGDAERQVSAASPSGSSPRAVLLPGTQSRVLIADAEEADATTAADVVGAPNQAEPQGNVVLGIHIKRNEAPSARRDSSQPKPDGGNRGSKGTLGHGDGNGHQKDRDAKPHDNDHHAREEDVWNEEEDDDSDDDRDDRDDSDDTDRSGSGSGSGSGGSRSGGSGGSNSN